MNRFIIVTGVIFVVLSGSFFAMRIYAPEYRFVALETGNVIMALLSIYSYLLVKRQMNGNPQAFVRGVYSASFLKLMVCMVSVLAYVMINRAGIHKPTIYVLFGIYAVYTVMETGLLSKVVKEKKISK